VSNPSRNAERWIACILPIVGGAGLLVFALVSLAREEGAGEFPMPGSPGAPQDQRMKIAAAPSDPTVAGQPGPAIEPSQPTSADKSEKGGAPIDERVPAIKRIVESYEKRLLVFPSTDEEVDALVSLVQSHPDPEMRRLSLMSLGVRLEIKDPISERWSRARYVLEVQNLAMEAAVQDASPDVRCAAIGVLVLSPSDAAWKTLGAKLQADPEAEVRSFAVYELRSYLGGVFGIQSSLYEPWSVATGNPEQPDWEDDDLFNDFFRLRRREAKELLAWAAEHDPDADVREAATLYPK
jgi:hypothetical protein